MSFKEMSEGPERVGKIKEGATRHDFFSQKMDDSDLLQGHSFDPGRSYVHHLQRMALSDRSADFIPPMHLETAANESAIRPVRLSSSA